MKNLTRAVFVSAAAMTASGVASAVSQGTEGATSTGSSDLTIEKTATVQITGLDDVTLTLAGADYVASDDVCVYSSGAAYGVTMSSSTGTNTFELTNGSDTLAYAVTWADEGGTAASVTGGTPLTGQTSTGDAACSGSGGANTTFAVTVTGAAYAAANAGSYTDTLTMVIAPD